MSVRLGPSLLAVALVLPAQVVAVVGYSALVGGLNPTPVGLMPADNHPSVVLPSQLALLAIPLVAAWWSPVPLRQRLGLVQRPGVAKGGLTVLAALALTQVFFFATFLLVPEQVMALQLPPQGPPPVPLLLGLGTLLGSAGFAAVGEELLYRGLLQRRLLTRFGPAVAILISSGLFAVAHGVDGALAMRFCIGVVLGVAAWRTGSVLPAMAGHCAVNLALVGNRIWMPLAWGVGMSAAGHALALVGCAAALALSLALLLGWSPRAALRRYTRGHVVSSPRRPQQA